MRTFFMVEARVEYCFDCARGHYGRGRGGRRVFGKLHGEDVRWESRGLRGDFEGTVVRMTRGSSSTELHVHYGLEDWNTLTKSCCWRGS